MLVRFSVVSVVCFQRANLKRPLLNKFNTYKIMRKKHIIKADKVVYVRASSYNSKREHTNIAKLNQDRIVSESYSGAKYQLKKGDVVEFDRTNNWDLSYYKTPCGVEFHIDCGFDWFEKNN